MANLLQIPVKPDGDALLKNLRREGTSARVHFMELYLDGEVSVAVAERFGLWDDIDASRQGAHWDREIKLKRFLGYDYVVAGLDGYNWPLYHDTVADTADSKRSSGRSFVNLHKGPITTWEEFEKYPWPDPDKCTTESLEYLEKNLPEDMIVVGGLTAHFAELLSWLMGYETLCFALYDDRELVTAIRDRLEDLEGRYIKRVLEFPRVKALWGSDDMGYRTGTLISPDDMREFVLRGHRMAAKQAHDKGMIYLLHSCGKLESIWPDLIDDVKVDVKHSFEDIIESVIETKERYGKRVSLIGGVDMDMMCRADEATIRARVREILDSCMPGGGYCLGTGNSVANYIPLDNYLIMLDEGRKYSA